MRQKQSSRLLLPVAVAAIGCFEKTGPVLGPPSNLPLPDAVAPVPSPAQVAWQTQEMAAFLHFGMNTFTNKEQGDGSESPTLFNPTAFDARQWITALRNGGFREALLTAKHHDGFCLWPTKCTTYSVAASPFRRRAGRCRPPVRRRRPRRERAGRVRAVAARSSRSELRHARVSVGVRVSIDRAADQLRRRRRDLAVAGAGLRPTFDWAAIRDLVRGLQPQTLLEFANVAPMAASDVRSIGLSAPRRRPRLRRTSRASNLPAARGPPPTSPPRRFTRFAPAGSGTRPRMVR